MRKLLAIGIGLFASCPMVITSALAMQAASQPQRWFQITNSDAGSVVYLDAERADFSGEMPTVWLRYDHTRDSTVPFRSSMVREQIDCATLRSRYLSITRYRADGTSFTEAGSGLWGETIPDSIGEQIARRVCELAREFRRRPAQ